MTITFPTNTADIIDQIRGAIGRDVNFIYVAGNTPCPTCSLDPITNTSTDSFCPTCSGYYFIPVISGFVTSGHITWGKSEMLNWQSGGQLFDGDCRVQVKYTSEILNVISKTKFLQVDGKELEIKKTNYRGVKDLNRVLLDCIERDNDV